MDMYILLYLKAITNKFLLYSTGHSAQCYVAAWMGRVFEERIDMYICRTQPFAVHLKLTTLLISYTSIQNKKLKK